MTNTPAYLVDAARDVARSLLRICADLREGTKANQSPRMTSSHVEFRLAEIAAQEKAVNLCDAALAVDNDGAELAVNVLRALVAPYR